MWSTVIRPKTNIAAALVSCWCFGWKFQKSSQKWWEKKHLKLAANNELNDEHDGQPPRFLTYPTFNLSDKPNDGKKRPDPYKVTVFSSIRTTLKIFLGMAGTAQNSTLTGGSLTLVLADHLQLRDIGGGWCDNLTLCPQLCLLVYVTICNHTLETWLPPCK